MEFMFNIWMAMAQSCVFLRSNLEMDKFMAALTFHVILKVLLVKRAAMAKSSFSITLIVAIPAFFQACSMLFNVGPKKNNFCQAIFYFTRG